MSSRPILVTGADGFIGSHLVERLLADGHQVRAFVLYNSFGSWGWLDTLPPETRRRIDVVAGDVRDPRSVRAALKGCGVVLHLAALIAIPYSYQAPHSYLETNIHGTLNILEAAREEAIERVVITSTSEVYGTPKSAPITEAHELNAQSPYAATKIAADQLALSFQRSFGTPVTVLRPFNAYGPRQSTRAVIPTIIMQIAAGKRRIRLGALHPTRDFSFVTDTAAGFVSIMACDGAIGQVVNIGSGYEISIGALAELIAEIMGVRIEIEEEAARLRPKTSEVERLLADVTKAEGLFRWQPRFAGRAGLKEGLEKTVAWFSDPANLGLYRRDDYTL
jgi:dTDP-glucose 4,6-dehydratase